jgi:hypothetical protein
MKASNSVARRLCGLGVAAALALPAGIVAVNLGASAPAGATTPPAAKGGITCSAVRGKITFHPPLTLNGTQSVTRDVAKVHATLSKCKATIGPSPTSGTVSTKIVTKNPSGKANSCTGLATTRAITLAIAWQRTPAIAPSVVSFSSDKIVSNAKGDEGFKLPGSPGTASVHGSYAGHDHGAKAHAVVYSNKTASQLAAACTTGMSSLKLTSGSATSK